MERQQRLIIGISGATGVVYAVRLLDVLKSLDVETHLVITKSAEMAISYESDLTAKQIRERMCITLSATLAQLSLQGRSERWA